MVDFLQNPLAASLDEEDGAYIAASQGPAQVTPMLNPAQAAEQEATSPGFLDTMSAAVQSTWIEPNVLRMFGAEGYAPDESWDPSKLTDEQRKELELDKRPKEFIEQLFIDSVSFEHAKAIAHQQDLALTSEKILAQAGGWGTTAAIVTSFLDPVAIGATIATDGMLAPAIIASKATRVGRVMRMGLLGGASNVALTAPLVAADPRRDATDLLWAGVFGMGIGGAVGGLTRGPVNQLSRSIDDARTNFAESANTSLTVEEALAQGALKGDIPAAPGAQGWALHLDEDGNPSVIKFVKEGEKSDVEPTWLPARDPLPTRDDLARQYEPELFARVDELKSNKEFSVEWLDELAAKRAANIDSAPEVAAIDRQIAKLTTKTTSKRRAAEAAAKLEELKALRDSTVKILLSTDTPDMARIRAGLMARDEKLRDLAPQIGAAYRRADEHLASLPLQTEPLPIRQVEVPQPKPVKPTDPDAPVTSSIPAAPDTPPKIEGSAGAAAAPYVNPMVSQTTEETARMWNRRRVQASDVLGQFDLYAKLARSAHAGVSWFVDQLTPNPSGIRFATGRPQGRTVVEDKEMLHKTLTGSFLRELNAAFAKWAKDTGVRLPALNIKAYRDFGVQVGKYISSNVRDLSVHPSVKQAATAYERMTAAYLKHAQDHGVAGFDGLAHDPTYLTRVFNIYNFARDEAEVGTMSLVRLFADAIRYAPTREAPMSFDEAERAAYLYIQWLKHSAYDQNKGMSPAFNGALVRRLRDRMQAAIATDPNISDEFRAAITPEQIDALIESVQNVGQAGVISRGKYRINMDENFSMSINGKTYTVSDYLERDVGRLALKYGTEMSGAIALARHPELQIKSASHWESMVNKMSQMAQTYHGNNINRFETEMQAVEILRRHIFGQPMTDMTARNAALHRMVRDYNYIRLGGKFGIAQLGEFGNVLGQIGYRAVSHYIPMMKLLRDPEEFGKLGDEFADELDNLGIGVERELGHPSMRDMDAMDSTSALLGKVEDAMAVGKRVTATYSLIGPLTDGMERMAAAAAAHKFTQMATGATRTLSEKRLQAIGLTGDMKDRVFAQLRQHVKVEESGFSGRKIKTLALDDWTDAEAREAFKTAIWRWSRRAVQRNDIGDLPMFMSSPYMQLFFQFRTFSLAAWSKQLVHGVRMHDATSAAVALSTFATAAITYTGLVHLNAIGRKDADAYRKKHLTANSIAKNAWARSGWASLLPSGVDTIGLMIGAEPQFSAGRTTGLDANFAFGNPTFDLATSALGVGAGVADVIRSDRQFSQQDARTLTGILPFNRAYGVSNAFQFLANDLPRKSHYDD